jgi:hypothetical protein
MLMAALQPYPPWRSTVSPVLKMGAMLGDGDADPGTPSRIARFHEPPTISRGQIAVAPTAHD